ncbi:MAG: nucleotidyltransferase domain-containing protein [Gammaproteobacteria bacterium]|nr:MAG: nucleotidyltransferase domain-containing protein [Gammaproteobacteria bacterium]RTZ67363.1 MAG: nucleotidyltransferase domain-containing protein [Aquificaceae bacterium]
MSKKIRLTEEEIKAIVETAKEVFGEEVKVWLFGSRVDLNKRGGDIDLYIEAEIPKGEILDKKLTFLVKLDEKIGEQKVDLIIRPPNSEDEISLTAKGSGVRLL